MPPAAKPAPPAPRVYSPLAALLSYLVPGLGQVYQGRVGKGVLFFVCLYTLFFSGMAMGSWKNVYLPEAKGLKPTINLRVVPPFELDGLTKSVYYRLQYLGQFWMGLAAWPALYQYATFNEAKDGGGPLQNFQRAPRVEELNDLQRDGDKRWDLGWIYTVIAGVLNILVIYDAFAGPVFGTATAAEAARRGRATL